MNLIVKFGDKNKIFEKDGLICELREDIYPNQLYSFLKDNLGSYKEVEIDLDFLSSLSFKNMTSEDVQIIFSSIYSYFSFVPFCLKKDKDERKKWNIKGNKSEKVKYLVEAQEFVRRLQETPPNLLNTKEFEEESRRFLSGIDHLSFKVIGVDEIRSLGLNLIEAVGRGSLNAPRLLIIEYKPNSQEENFRVLVGKGVCFDTGGLNIKTGSYMASMKFDMSGAAVSIGTIYSLSKCRSKQNVVVLVPLVENSVSSSSYRPDDVVVSFCGKSVEIDNTDAEGRLILADSLSYGVDKYKPKEIISIATLTGAIGYALGYKYAGAWTTSDEQWNDFNKSSIKGGDWIWRMPLDDYYLKALKNSRVADLKNSAATGAGGASRAACFLKEFVDNTPYVHLDIANIAHGEGNSIAQSPLLKTLFYYLLKE